MKKILGIALLAFVFAPQIQSVNSLSAVEMASSSTVVNADSEYTEIEYMEADPPPVIDPSTFAKLQQENADLKAKVADLTAQVAALTATIAKMNAPPVLMPVPTVTVSTTGSCATGSCVPSGVASVAVDPVTGAELTAGAGAGLFPNMKTNHPRLYKILHPFRP